MRLLRVLFLLAACSFAVPAKGDELVPSVLLKGQDQKIWQLAFSPDGRTLAAHGGECLAVRLWDWRAGEDRADVGALAPFVFTPTGHRLFAPLVPSDGAARTSNLAAFYTATGRVSCKTDAGVTPSLLSPSHLQLAVTGDGKYVAAVGRDFNLIDAGTGESLRGSLYGRWKVLVGIMHCRGIVSAGGGNMLVWPWALWQGGNRLNPALRLTRFDFTAGKVVGEVQLTVPKGDDVAPNVFPAQDFSTALGAVESLAPDGSRFARVTLKDRKVTVWDTDRDNTGRVLACKCVAWRPWDRPAFAPGGRLLALHAGNGKVEVWDVGRDRRVYSWQVPKGEGENPTVTALAFSPDGRALAVGIDSGKSAATFRGRTAVLSVPASKGR
jgi:WD40 repeat protein